MNNFLKGHIIHLGITVFAVLFNSSFLFSQKYNFENISDKYLLNQSYIYEINQSKNDELLIATEDGLLNFNGLQFSLQAKSVLKDEAIINKVSVLANGTVILGYVDGTILKRVGADWSIIKQNKDETGKIIEIQEADNGIPYILIQGKGIYSLSKSKLSKVNFDGLESTEIIDFKIIKNKLIAIVENNVKIYEIAKGEINPIYLLLSSKIRKAVNNEQYLKIHTNNSSHFFIQTSNNNLVCCSMGEKSEVNNVINLNFIASRFEKVIVLQKTIWVATQSDGLFKLDFVDNQYNSYGIKNFTIANGLVDNHLKSIFIDSRNVLWVGYYGFGLSRLRDENIRLYDGFETQNITEIYSIVSDKAGSIYLGTNSGLFRFNPGNGNYLAKVNLNLPLKNLIVTSLIIDANNRLWIGTKEQGVFIYEISSSKLTSVESEFGHSIRNVNSIVANKNGNVYLATDFGMFYFSAASKTISKITTNEGLVHNVLNQICVDDKNNLWFAANDATLFKYDKQEFHIYKDIKNLNSYKLSSIIQNSDRNIVFGTEGDGFFIFNEDTSIQISSKDGLKSDYVYTVLEDNNSNIWAFHKKSISIYNLKSKLMDEIKLESIFNSTLQRNAVYKDQAGLIWIGTNKGLLRLSNPGKTASMSPVLNVNKILLNNKLIPRLKSDYTYDEYSLRYEFMGVNLLNPEGVSYEYILEGFEKEWNHVNYSHTYAYYPKLQDGNYKFRLFAKYKDGSKSAEYVSQFNVSTPLWKTFWFWILLFVLFVTLIGFLFRWRLNYINIQKAKLEQQVKLRTVELSTERNNLLKANTEIERKSNDILDSINYAKRLQNAVLPSTKRWEKALPKSFIFYKPKAIVAGDFYWLMTASDTVYFAAGDCTGHGVPGAMVSVFCADALTRSVKNRKMTEPASILNQTRQFVIEMFENSEEDVRDGMDVSLCCLNLKTLELNWAGANNPLWIVRSGQKTIEVFEADKQPVGNSYNQKPFTNHLIQLAKSDKIYLFTDGFADQFGGKDKRKFRSSGMKNMLLDISHLDLEEQKKVVYDTFNKWKGDMEQIDDVCLIGLEI